jgi:hypothetical protein
MSVTRRGLITGLGALFVAAPAIVRASNIMPIRSWTEPTIWRVTGERKVFWVDSRGLLMMVQPDQVMDWNTFIQTRPNELHDAVYDVAPELGTPSWVGFLDRSRFTLGS